MPTRRRSSPTALGKLRRPHLGRVFARERLFAALDAAAQVPLTWVAGPPGMGKTTLVATYLEARATTCLWLQLDAGDADPASFVHFLLAALAQQAPRRALRWPPPANDDMRDFTAYLRRLFRRMSAAVELPWALVLDNVQELPAGSAVHAALVAVCSELPERARLFCISREPPPGAYAAAQARQQLALIDERQLRFSDDDTRQLVALHGRHWSAAELQQATDGWAAGMILLLATRDEIGLHEALRGGLARARLFAFFAGEVLAAMSRREGDTLMRIAFLPSSSVAMAVALTGDAQAGELLADLARRSLFTERREGLPPVYTLHALFSEFLRTRAVEQWSEATLQEVHRAAARLLAGHGQADAAIQQLLAAQQWHEALQLLLSQCGGLVAQGRTALLRECIAALPASLSDSLPDSLPDSLTGAQRADAQLAYWRGCCESAADPALALRHFERAHQACQRLGDEAGAFRAAAAAADAVVSIGANLHALDAWMPLLRAHAAAFLAQPDDEAELRVLPGLLAAFVHLETAHPLTAVLAARAERLLDQPLGPNQRIVLGTLAYYLLWTGQTQRLDRIMLKLDRLCAASDAAPGTLLRWYGVSVLIRALLGRVDEALQHAQQALALARAMPGGGPAAVRAKAHLLVVLAAVAGRDRTLARTHLAEAAPLLDAAHAIDATTYEFQRGLLMLLDADWTGAHQLMRAAVTSGGASGWPLREHIALLGQALAAAQVGRFDEAEEALLAAQRHPFRVACLWHQWLGALIEAHLARCQGQQPRALQALAHALALGREHGFDFGPMPFSCGDMMPRLAALALEHDIDAAFARHIIQRHALPAPPDAGPRWPWPIRIHALGAFGIEREWAAAGTPSRKESRKPLDLLKLLLALAPVGGGAVAVERLCAALWPDAEGDAARNSFDNTLHRLRKLLGSERCLLLHSGGLSLDTAWCWTDVAALERCCAALQAVAADPDAQRTLAWADQALALYRGPLAVGEDELPDIVAARARIGARFTRHMAAAGARLERGGDLAEAARVYERVLELQPLAEDICRQLIRCLVVLGRRAEAFEAYRRCRQQLLLQLNLRPTAQTEALVDPIREAGSSRDL